MSTIELLAKIDALDWEKTMGPDTTVMVDNSPGAGIPPPAKHSWSLLKYAAAGAVACIVATLVFVGLNFGRSQQVLVERTAPPAATAAPQVVAVAAPEAPRADDSAAKAAAEAEAQAKAAQAKSSADRAATARRLDKQRKAKAAEDARLEQLQREEARLRAEREAEQARLAAAKAHEQAAAPKAPTSPRELCSSEANVFSRGFCEARACGKPEWRNHPFCQKRIEDQLRPLGG